METDWILIGNGLAPLIAAKKFLDDGDHVTILNPERDFFLENSELPFAPLWASTSGSDRENFSVQSFRNHASKTALEFFRDLYPGTLEYWDATLHPSDSPTQAKRFHNFEAPHVRKRNRIWIQEHGHSWDQVEDFYIEALDAGLKPLILEGLSLQGKFPGLNPPAAPHSKAIQIGDFSDLDVHRYRMGFLEFLRERLPPESFVTFDSDFEWTATGIRNQKFPKGLNVNKGAFLFWTPQMSHYIRGFEEQGKLRQTLGDIIPKDLELYEQWSVISKAPLDPSAIGQIGNLMVWCDLEGAPTQGPRELQNFQNNLQKLCVLRKAAKISSADFLKNTLVHKDSPFCDENSFKEMSELFSGFLNWDKFTLRQIETRTLFCWTKPFTAIDLIHTPVPAKIVTHCDGPMQSVVRSVLGAIGVQT